MKLNSKITNRAENYLDALNSSVVFILDSLLGCNDVTLKRIYSRRLNSLPNDIIVTVDYSTDWQGYFAFMLPLKTANMICEKLVPGIDNRFFDADHLDIIGEFANMISGNCISRLKLLDSGIYLKEPTLKPFHSILSEERSSYMFSLNYNLNPGKLGILLSIQKDTVEP